MFDGGRGERFENDGRDFVAPQKNPEIQNDQSNREPEIEEQAASNRPERKFEELPEEEQRRLLESGLAGMKLALGDVKDYTVFASTAMYLNGEDLLARGEPNGRELMTPPGDFDAAVFSEESLDKIRDRITKIKEPTHRFIFAKVNEAGEQERDEDGGLMFEEDFSGYVRVSGEEMKKLAGKFVFNAEVDGKETPVEYDFELFNKSRVVTPELAEGRTKQIDGLNVLDLEGLQKQYEKNLAFESRIEKQMEGDKEKGIVGIAEFLGSKTSEIEQLRSELTDGAKGGELSGNSKTILEHFEMAPKDMKRVFELQDLIDEIEKGEPATRLSDAELKRLEAAFETAGRGDKVAVIDEKKKRVREFIQERAKLLANVKTKVWKRQLNVLQLARLRGKE